MNITTMKITTANVSKAFAIGLLSASLPAFSQTTLVDVTFGSANDGLGGFQQSTIDGADSDTTFSPTSNDLLLGTPYSVRYENTGAVTGGTQNHSLLRSTSIDRSNGKQYTMTGNLRWSSYADDNNRVGMYLFGDDDNLGDSTPTNGEEEEGALGLIYNADDALLLIKEGIDNGVLTSSGLTGTTPFTRGTGSTNVFTDYSLDFSTDIHFYDNAGTDSIDIDFSMTYLDDTASPVTDTVNFTVAAADYTGDLFGFVGRGRNRGDTSPGAERDGPFVVTYNTFTMVEAIPEPTTLGLLAVAIGGLTLYRRRKR